MNINVISHRSNPSTVHAHLYLHQCSCSCLIVAIVNVLLMCEMVRVY